MQLLAYGARSTYNHLRLTSERATAPLSQQLPDAHVSVTLLVVRVNNASSGNDVATQSAGNLRSCTAATHPRELASAFTRERPRQSRSYGFTSGCPRVIYAPDANLLRFNVDL